MQHNCPDRRQLTGYVIGTLAETEAESIADHVDGCTDCEATVEHLERQHDTVMEKLRAGPPHDPFADEPGLRKAEELVAAVGREWTQSQQQASGQSKAEPELGKLGQYKLLAKIGQGGMGAVYKALHTRLRRVVALKVLPAERLGNEAAIARFDREMEAVGQLNHPNIVVAHDAGDIDDQHYLVMELVEGVDLSALVRRCGSLPVAEACEVIRQAAEGLQHAHTRGMVHRDIKPSNLMLAETDDGAPIVKVLDMGLALLETVAPGRELTTDGQLMGTLDYMAPEQGTDTHGVDIRADVYALGATLCKLLTGQNPFPAKDYQTPLKLMMAKATKDAPPVSQLRDDLPADLAALVDRMLSRDPEKRPATPAEVVVALTPFAKDADLMALLRPSGSAASRTASAAPEQSQQVTHEHLTSDSHETAAESAATVRPISPTIDITAEPAAAPATSALLRKPWFIGSAAATLAVGLLLILWAAGVIFRVETTDGTLVVKVTGDDFATSVQGKTVTIQNTKTQEKYTIKLDSPEQTKKLQPGKYKFLLETGSGLKTFTDQFTIASGKNEQVEVRWEPKVTQVSGDDKRSKGWQHLPVDAPPPAIAPFNAEQARRHQQAWAKYLGVPDEKVFDLGDGQKLTMVLIPPGEFTMGATADEQTRFLNQALEYNDRLTPKFIQSERPQHQVRITKPFWLCQYEVTRSQFRRFVQQSKYNGIESGVGNEDEHSEDVKKTADPKLAWNDDAGFPQDDKQPVINVNWNDAQSFCRWLSKLPAGMQFHLPTESQWEFACRAGTTTIWHCGNSNVALHEYSWLGGWNRKLDQRPKQTQIVGRLKPNAFGLYDMHGNVWEWCSDWYEHYSAEDAIDPAGPKLGSLRIYRGGCWRGTDGYCRSAARYADPPDSRYVTLGFRVAAEVETPQLTAGAAVKQQPAPTDNYALSFDGQDDYVEIPSLNHKINGPITVEAICRVVDLNRFTLVNLGSRETSEFVLRSDGQQWRFERSAGSKWISQRGSQGVKPGPFFHIAGVWDGSQLRLFVDGVLQPGSNDTNKSRRRTQLERLLIGGLGPGIGNQSAAPTELFGGVIDELRISKAARYTSKFQAPKNLANDENTLALYHFDSGQGAKLVDSSGNNHHGVIHGASWVKTVDASPPPAANYALNFNGKGYVDLPTLEVDLTKPFTFECYAHFKVRAGDRCGLIYKKGQQGFGLFSLDGESMLFERNAFPRAQARELPGWTFKPQPMHIAVTSDTRSTRVFIDGVLSDSRAFENIQWTGKSAFLLGALWSENAPKDYLMGTLDEVRFSSTVRYTQNFTPEKRFQNDKDTLALYHFDSGQGDKLVDSSGNNHHGVIHRASWVKADGGKFVPMQSSRSQEFALQFDGRDDYVTIPSLNVDWSKGFTIEGYLRLTGQLKHSGKVFSPPIGDDGLAVEITQNPNTQGPKLQVAIHDKSVGKGIYSEDLSQTDRPTHFAVAWSEGNARIFVDGKLVREVPVAKMPAAGSSGQVLGMMLRANGDLIGETCFLGQLDELRISRIVRYTRNFTPQKRFTTDKDTLALYHFDSGQGDKLVDSSGNNHHGVIHRASWVRVGENNQDPDRRAAEWVLSQGGNILVAIQGTKRMMVDKASDLPSEAFSLIQVFLAGNQQVTNDSLQNLQALRNLELLKLENISINDTALAHLADLPKLETIFLTNTKVQGSGFVNLAALLNLGSLYLWRTEVDDNGLAAIKQLKNLHSLDLRNTRVTDAGMSHIAALPNLDILQLSETTVGDRGLANLKPILPQLSRLEIGRTKISNAGLEPLKSLPKLKFLYLDRTQIGDAGVQHLKHAPALEILSLIGTKITDAAMPQIARFTSLRDLYLEGADVSDDGLKQLANLKALRFLKVTGTKVTAEGVNRLHRSIPQCKIIWDGGTIEPEKHARTPQDRRQAIEAFLRAGGRIHAVGTNGIERLYAKLDDLRRLSPTDKVIVLELKPQQTGDDALLRLFERSPIRILSALNSSVTDEGMQAVGSLRDLEHLSLGLSKGISDAGIQHLANCPKLGWVDLSQCPKIGSNAVAVLARLPALRILDVSYNKLDDKSVAPLAQCKSLRRIFLNNTSITDATIELLARNRQLEALHVIKTGVTDKSLVYLSEHRQLEEINLKGTKVTSEGVQHLHKSIPQCRIIWDGGIFEPSKQARVYLQRRQAIDKVLLAGGGVDTRKPNGTSQYYGKLEALQNLTEQEAVYSLILSSSKTTNHDELLQLFAGEPIQQLNLHKSSVSDAGLNTIGNMQGLEFLEIGGTKITDKGVKYLAKCRNLKSLNLTTCNIGLNSIEVIAALTRLEELYLQGNDLEDKSLSPLARMTTLRQLDLTATKITDAALKNIVQNRGLEKLEISQTQISDNALAHLATLQQLKSLNLKLTKVTAAGVEKLKKALPMCKIIWDGGTIQPASNK